MFSDEHTANQADVNPDTAQPRESGWFLMSRCIFEHPIVGARAGSPRVTKANPNPVPYGWAWLWLLREASYKARVKVVRGKEYRLGIGELACSESFMASAWGWSEKAVQCYMRKLRDHKMLKWGGQKGTDVRVVTICNYPKYQMKLQPQGTSEGTTDDEFRATTRKKVINKSKTPPTPSRGDEPVLPFIPEAEAQNTPKTGHDRLTQAGNAPALEASEVRIAFDRWNAVAKTCALPTAKSLTEGRAKKIRARLKVGGLTDWDKALSEVARSKFMRGLTKPTPGRKPFKADLEFVLQEKYYNRLVEGFYTRNAGDVVPSSGNHSAVSEAQQREAEILAELREKRATVGKVNSILT